MSRSANFDAIAFHYDAEFTNSLVGRLQRQQVWKWFKHFLTPNDGNNLLEINCGTGEDADWLIENGYQVLITDLSPKMIQVASERLRGVQQVTCKVAGFHELATMLNGQTFDIIFSNFAGLNCEATEELVKLNDDLASLLSPNGKLVMVVLGKKCWMERLYFLIQGKWGEAFRRTKPTFAKLGNGATQLTYVYTVKKLKHIFSSFKLLHHRPIGIVIPPSYLEDRLKRFSWAVPAIVMLEQLLSRFPFFSDYADHTFVLFEKK